MGVDRPGQSEHMARELTLGRSYGRVDGVVAAHVDQGIDIVGTSAQVLAISSRRVAESVSFQQAR